MPTAPEGSCLASTISSDKTIRHYGELWHPTIGGHARHTRIQYRNALEFWYRLLDPEGKLLRGRALGDVPVLEISQLELRALIGKHKWASPKLRNNYMIPLRGTMAAACAELRIPDPLVGVKNLKVQKPKPDPFTLTETERILTYMQQHFDERVWAYFNWQFFTGMRPEETIALNIGKLDFSARVAVVDTVRTAGEDRPYTKTHQARSIDVTWRAWQSIVVMQKYWGLRKHGLVFERPSFIPPRGVSSSGKSFNRGKPAPAGPWNNERSQRDTYWRPTLEALGIRYRKPYKTRHTFATIGLMSDAPAGYMARQLGHDKEQFFQVYTRWIDGDQNKLERAKIDRMLAATLSPQASPSNCYAPGQHTPEDLATRRKTCDRRHSGQRRANPRARSRGPDGNFA